MAVLTMSVLLIDMPAYLQLFILWLILIIALCHFAFLVKFVVLCISDAMVPIINYGLQLAYLPFQLHFRPSSLPVAFHTSHFFLSFFSSCRSIRSLVS